MKKLFSEEVRLTFSYFDASGKPTGKLADWLSAYPADTNGDDAGLPSDPAKPVGPPTGPDAVTRFRIGSFLGSINHSALRRAIDALGTMSLSGVVQADLRDPSLHGFLVPAARGDVARGDIFFPVPLVFDGSTDWPEKGIMPGAVVVFGDTNSGKTHYIRRTAKVDVIVRFGEPFEDVDLGSTTVMAGGLIEALEMVILLSLCGQKVACDSLRSIVYSLDSNTMEGGMSAGIFDVVTGLNNLMAMVGATALFVVNPLLADETKADRLALRVAASASGLIHLRDRKVVLKTFRKVDGRTMTTSDYSSPSNEVLQDFSDNVQETSHAQDWLGETERAERRRSVEASVLARKTGGVGDVGGSTRSTDDDVVKPRTFAPINL